MTAGPGRIDGEIAVDLPRPRDVSSPEFNAIRREVSRRLTEPRDIRAVEPTDEA